MSRVILIATLVLGGAGGGRVTCAGFQHGRPTSGFGAGGRQNLLPWEPSPTNQCADTHRCSCIQEYRRKASRGNALKYQRDPNDNDRDPSRNELKVAWLALKKTEDWIRSRLESSTLSNPYTRKEVTFECESSDNVAVIVANTFRRLREARELGELQQREETKQFFNRGKGYMPGTFRRTQVIVLPSCDLMNDSFDTFDSMLRAVNFARDNVDDLIRPEGNNLEWLTNSMKSNDEGIELDVRVNCAHMHPDFGKLNIEAMAQDMMRSEAKRSPFPTIVIEVHVSPTIKQKSALEDTRERRIADIQKLEILFRLPAALDTSKSEVEEMIEVDKNAIASNSTGHKKGSSEKPMDRLAYEWIASNDPNYDECSSEITVGADLMSVDVGYEFVFSHIGIDLATRESEESTTLAKRKYLVLPNFLTQSATRFESFSREILRIIEAVGMSDCLSVSVLHPEHVNKDFRSPVPVLLLKWFEGA